MMGLTSRQRELLTFLKDEQLAGRSPSLDDMGQALGLRSKSGVWRLVNGLEDRGYIRRLPNMARAIEVVEVAGPCTVHLNPEVFAGVSDYAAATGASIEVATNELLRQATGLA